MTRATPQQVARQDASESEKRFARLRVRHPAHDAPRTFFTVATNSVPPYVDRRENEDGVRLLVLPP